MDCSVRTVKQWIAEGKVIAVQTTPNGEWRINRASLDAWLESLRSRCSPRDVAPPTFDCEHPDDGYQIECPICGALRTGAAAGS